MIEKTENTPFTRMCIGEAIVSLLHTTEFHKVTISAVVKKAGVSRMTFYYYYDSLYAALVDYLDIMVSGYYKAVYEKNGDHRWYLKYSHILYALNYFDDYSDFFLTLAQRNLYSVLLDGINRFLTGILTPCSTQTLYKLYAYAGSLLNTFLRWEKAGKKEQPEEIAVILYKLFEDDDLAESL